MVVPAVSRCVHACLRACSHGQVRFEGEEGIDQGGVKKEFFQIMVRRMFAADFGTAQQPRPAHDGAKGTWAWAGPV